MKIGMLLKCAALGALGMAGSARADRTLGGDWGRYPELGLPRLTSAPEVDGVLDDVEWAMAARLPPMLDGKTGRLDEDRTDVYAAHTSNALYIAWRAFRPRGVPLVLQAPRPGYHPGRLVYLDDCLELFIRLPGAQAPMISFAGNAAGAYGDGQYNSGLTNFEPTWPWRFAARQTDDGWEGEVAIAFAALGLDTHPAPEDVWGMEIWRNNKTPNATLAQLAYSQRHPARLARVRFPEAAPAFRVLQTGRIGDNAVGMLAELIGAQVAESAVQVAYGIYRRRDTAPDINLLETFDAGLDKSAGSASTDVAAFIGMSQSQAESKMMRELLRFFDPLIERRQEVRLAPSGRAPLHFVATEAVPGDYVLAYRIQDHASNVLCSAITPITHRGAIQVETTPYFLHERVLVSVTVRSPSLRERLDTVKLELHQAERLICATNVAGGARLSVLLPANAIAPGTYRVTATARDAAGAVLGRADQTLFRPEAPAWLQEQPGTSAFVPPPWTPVRETNHQIQVWGRQYRFENGFLPQGIVSQDGEILAGAPRLFLTIGGVDQAWSGTIRVAYRSDESVTLEWQGRAGSIPARASMSVEFDGLCTVDVELDTGGATIDRFWVELPLRVTEAELYGLNWTQYGLPRESKVADAGVLGESLSFGFKPGVWLGRAERGLQWMAESNEHWRSKPGRAIEVLPGERETVLRLRVVDRPFVTPGRIRYRWGLMASPVKPFDTAMNRNTFYAQLSVPREFYTGEQAGIDKFQRDLKIARELGATWINTFHWLNRYPPPFGPDTFSEPFLEDPDQVAAHRRAVEMIHALGMRHTVYTGWNAMDPKMAAYPYYGEAMKRTPSRFSAGAYKPCMRGGYIEYQAGGVAWLAKNLGVEGVYLDGTAGLQPCLDPAHGCGYVQAETGQRVVTYNIWAHRELFKRMYKILHGEVVTNGLIYSHAGGAPLLAIEAFADIRHGAEGVSLEHYLDLSGFRSRYYGRTFGIPLELTWVYQAPRNLVWGVGLLHDTPIKMYSAMFHPPHRGQSYTSKGCIGWRTWIPRRWFDWTVPYAWHPYDLNRSTLKRAPETIEASFYLNRRGQAILAAVNLSEQEQRAQFAFDLKALGMPGTLHARDAVTDETFEISDGRFALHFAGHRPRLLMIAREPIAAPAVTLE